MELDKYHHEMFKEFLRLVGEPPPKLQCPGGSLSEETLERLNTRPDLIEWALGVYTEEC